MSRARRCAARCGAQAGGAKKTFHASERDSERVRRARRRFCRRTARLPARRLVFVDESGVNITLARRYGRAPGGQRAHGTRPINWSHNVSLIGALSTAGVVAVMSVAGSTDAAAFCTYLRQVLAPRLGARDVVVMDNLSVHKVREVRRIVSGSGARLLYLPPYSPDLSPIEQCWSKVKTYLRSRAARSYEALDEAITEALSKITVENARAWFKHCGYRVSRK